MNHPLKRIATRFSSLYKNHQRAWLFLFCVLLASSFWTFNSLHKTYVYTVYCPLGTGYGNDTLAITLEGKGFDLYSLLTDDSLPVIPPLPSVYFGNSVADTSPVEIPSEKFINLAQLQQHELRLVSILPQTIRPEQRVISARMVPVRLNLIGAGSKPGQLDPGPVIVRPDSIQIYGPYSVIRDIHEVFTDSVRQPDTPGITFKGVTLKNPNPSDVRLAASYVWVYCKVEELTEGSFVLPLKQLSGNGRYRVQTVPSGVKVVFQAPASEIRNIKASDFVISVKQSDQHNSAEVILEKSPELARHIRLVPPAVECYQVEQL